ncbi:glycosyltransferase family 4 protein [Vibrio maerlii]|uniref:glycosyltransferase family 4 protein n=1 Tax=Vibrio maerlii TaxID=2231648 RepID=UPI000E3C00E6|nr:glycosyltransferase family 4 protein [Vibrio maerlii]
MNILYLCHEYPPAKSGGVGIFTQEVAEAIVTKSHQNKVVIYSLVDGISSRVEHLKNGVHIIQEPRYKGLCGFIVNRVLSYFSLSEIIKEHQIELLEVQDFQGLLAFYPSLGIPTVTRLHGSVTYFQSLLGIKRWKDYVWRWLEQSQLKNATDIVSVSHFTAQETKRLFSIKEEIPVIHNGISCNFSCDVSNTQGDIRVFAYSGSLIAKKGIEELIDGWIAVGLINKNIELWVFGKDIENRRRELEHRLAQNGVTTVKFFGHVPKTELLRHYVNVDYCIFPSKAEAFSLAPMESMAMRKVVLYSDQTSAKELIEDNIDGVLIAKCTPQAIQEAIEYVLSEPVEKLEKMAICGQQKIFQQFSVEKKVAENIMFYERVIQRYAP